MFEHRTVSDSDGIMVPKLRECMIPSLTLRVCVTSIGSTNSGLRTV